MLIEELAAAGERRVLAPGELLCSEGDESNAAYIVLSGRIEAYVGTGDRTVVLGHHEHEALIGEVTALVGGHRTASLRAVDETAVSVVGTDLLRSVFDRHPAESAEAVSQARDRTDRSRVAALLTHELDTTDGEAVAAVAERVTLSSLRSGEILFEAGEAADSAYLVLSGRLTVETADGTQITQVGRGGIVGEFGLLEDRARTATIRALRDSGLARLTGADFGAITATHTGLAMGFVRRIVERSGQETSIGSNVGRSACVVVTAPADVRMVTSKMVDALDNIGSTAHLSAARVDAMLGAANASTVRAGGVGETRLIELLHQVDADHDHVVLEGHVDHPEWTERAIRHADQVVVLCSADPLPDEELAIRALLAQVPAQTPTWLALSHPPEIDRPVGTAAIRDRFGVDEVHHVSGTATTDLARVARLAVGEGYAVVLSGGGARGFAHIGAVGAMEDHGVPIDRIAGASMGAVIAASIAQQIDPTRRVELAQRQFTKLLDYTIPVVSLVKGERITKSIHEQWGGYDIEDLWLPFSCVATNLTTAQVVQQRTGPTDVAVRASVAIPGVLPPVPVDGDLLIDGGVLDNLPVDLVADDYSIGTVIAVDVTPPLGPRAKADFGLSVSGWSALRDQLSRRKNQYPGVVSILMRTMLIGSARDRDITIASDRVDLYVDLELKRVSLLDFETVEEVAARGHEASLDRIGEWWSERQSSFTENRRARSDAAAHNS